MSILFASLLYAVADSAAVSEVTHLGLKTSEWIMIVAIVVGPILAVVTQILVQRRHEKRGQKLWVFGTLMSSRATVIAPDFVKALNYIDVVFYNNVEVRNRWKTLLDHFNSDMYKDPDSAPKAFEKARDLTAELLAEMAKDLNYKYDYSHIKGNMYYPKGHGEIEQQTADLRQLGIAVMKGESRIKVEVTESTPAPQSVAGMTNLRRS